MTKKPLGILTLQEAHHLVELLQSNEKRTRSFAWHHAGQVGAPAIADIASLLLHKDIEIRLAAKRALRAIAVHVGRPAGIAHAKEAAIEAYMALLAADKPTVIRKEALWCLAEIAGEEAVEPIAALLHHPQLREDARMVLAHLGSRKAVEALRKALAEVPEDFRSSVAQGLRRCGVNVAGYPCKKRVPVKQTEVKPQRESRGR